jgi:hypothetical protein
MGRRAVDKTRAAREQNLVEWARPSLNNAQKLARLIDPSLDGQYSTKAAQKAAAVAYQCLSHNPKSRPIMSAVVEALEPLLGFNDIPPGPFVYTAPQTDDKEIEKSNESRKKHEDGNSNKSESESVNGTGNENADENKSGSRSRGRSRDGSGSGRNQNGNNNDNGGEIGSQNPNGNENRSGYENAGKSEDDINNEKGGDNANENENRNENVNMYREGIENQNDRGKGIEDNNQNDNQKQRESGSGYRHKAKIVLVTRRWGNGSLEPTERSKTPNTRSVHLCVDSGDV